MTILMQDLRGEEGGDKTFFISYTGLSKFVESVY